MGVANATSSFVFIAEHGEEIVEGIESSCEHGEQIVEGTEDSRADR